MAAYNGFYSTTSELANATQNFGSHVYKVMLVNSPAPVATNTVKSDLTEIAAGNGYFAGGSITTISQGTASATTTIIGTAVTFTASGGTIGPFRYAVLYNSTNNNLFAWWDYGSNLTLNAGDSFSVFFSGGTLGGAIFTLTF
jgi:hypothetical protein